MTLPLMKTQIRLYLLHEYLVEEVDELINGGESSFRALVFNGRKSNLAHLCAKRLKKNLCASFFISHSPQTDDHVRFFPTIAWQLSIQFPTYLNLLEKELRSDPSILHKTLEVQFEKLIADPLRKLLTQDQGQDFGQRKVILIDGLEEYGNIGTRQKIRNIIVEGAGGLPFIWLIFGRARPSKPSLESLLMQKGAPAIHWKEGYPALKEATCSRSVHGFFLLHSRSRFKCFQSKNSFVFVPRDVSSGGTAV